VISIAPWNEDTRRGVARKIPDGYYTRGEVADMTKISVATLKRWNRKGHVVPALTEEHGQVTIGLYSEAQVNALMAHAPYRKPGPVPEKDKEA
jgi:hypothetical protein